VAKATVARSFRSRLETFAGSSSCQEDELNVNLRALSTSTKLLLGAGSPLFIDMFLSWQKVCAGVGGFNVCGSRSGWHGWGVPLGLLVIALLVWEGAQLAGVRLAGVPSALVTAAIASGILLFGLIKFLVDNEFRHWPAWAGLILAIAIAIGGWLRLTGGAPESLRHGAAPGV
jgi:hypothetical protein